MYIEFTSYIFDEIRKVMIISTLLQIFIYFYGITDLAGKKSKYVEIIDIFLILTV